MRMNHAIGWLAASLAGLGVVPADEGVTGPVPGVELPVRTPAGEELLPVDLAEPAAATLADLIRHAVANSPALRAAAADERAARAAVFVAGALPDPHVGVDVAVEPVETRVGPQRARFMLSQTLPGRGKRGAREGVARAAVETAARRYEREAARLAYRVAAAYYDYYFLHRSLQVTRDNRDLLVYLEEIVRTSYKTGKSPYADLIREQVEIGRLENDLRSLEDRLRPARERLNSLLHRSPGAPLPEPVIDPGPGKPDWKLSLGYTVTGPARMAGVPDSGDDPISVGVSVNVPLWRKKYRALVRQAEEQRRAGVEARDAAEDELRDEVAWALYEFRNAEREVDLYRDTLLPKSTQSLEASQAGFRAGTATVLDVVDAQRVMLSFQLAYERALAARARAVAELRMLAGEEVVRSDADRLVVALAGGGP
jgi:outer membrane protein TolC